jgi:hypothetical protein
MPSRELVNELTWSKSRHGKFEECRRLYWFHYYGSWGGWEASAPPRIREAYVLKNLSTRQQWAGKVVHDTIAYALSMARAGDAPEIEQLVKRARTRMRDDFRRSRAGEYRARPKRVVGLVEHELKIPIPDSEWKANWDVAETCLRRFHASTWLAKARQLQAADWLPIDEIDSFLLDGIRVFAGPDFAFREGGSTVLVDWKTGRQRDEDHEQVKGYALFAAAKWNAAPEQVIGRLVYLGAGQEVDVNVTPDALEGFRAFFRQSVAGMKALLRDPEHNVAVEEDFPQTAEPGRCRSCAFQKLCGRG